MPVTAKKTVRITRSFDSPFGDGGYVDFHGGHRHRENWVFPNQENKTKAESPYGYTDHYLWGRGQDDKDVHGVYSDRLSQWHGDKYRTVFAKHLSDGGFHRANAETASNFLSELLDKRVTVVGVSEGCNRSNGFPYWVLYYREDAI